MATIFYSLLDIIVINGLEKSFFHLTSLTNKICCHRIKDLRFDGTFLFLLNLCSVFYIYIYIYIYNNCEPLSLSMNRISTSNPTMELLFLFGQAFVPRWLPLKTVKLVSEIVQKLKPWLNILLCRLFMSIKRKLILYARLESACKN